MTKRNPDKREQNRLKKLEARKQDLRYRAADLVRSGRSYREVASMLGTSHQFVSDWAHRLLHVSFKWRWDGKKNVKKVEYSFKKGFKELLKTKRPGPAPGHCPKVDEIFDRVVEQKKRPYCKNIGAKKIGIMSGVDASHPTVMKALRKAGFGPVTKPKRKHRKYYCKDIPNDLWHIDYVELGKERGTGKSVVSLSIIDDCSRMIFNPNVTTSESTQHAMNVLEDVIAEFGPPKEIMSDHGSQFYSTSGGVSSFDVWSADNDIRHIMSAIRTPEQNGKVERFHGSIRRELELPEEATLEEYQRTLEDFVEFYNEERPHCSLRYLTPQMVYHSMTGC